ncbi:alpha-ketoacid dehydrogenase kinase [Rhizoctonia solani]|uniref:Protein-serine/threonine kinase n=1 Tax=Rhizoctonia solani TaxID=456999 RepID=A0A8H8NPN4_9AGAM|nr:alpha-ketoacid dehydrogenase kinase [Rhizoctonia solani]QRW16022.1 alpha-ketoacid dehydrogenase kinase [Rhizoctonia solani]
MRPTYRPFRYTGKTFDGARGFSTGGEPLVTTGGLHFYRNKQMEVYAAKPAHRLSLRQLLFFGRQMDQGRILKSANYVRTELPVRIAHRIRDLQALPYVVVKQEWVAKVYEATLLELRKYPEIHTQNDNQEFCKFLRGILDEHAPVIPWISLGLSLSSHQMVPEQLDAFMRRMLVSRISRRVLAEHHLALTEGLAQGDIPPESPERPQGADANFETLNDLQPTDPPSKSDWRWPEVILDGDLDTKFAYIKEHFEYIVFELLKNAMRHTVLRNGGLGEPAPIRATIVAGPDIMNVRISDQGGGLRSSSSQTAHDMFSFSHVRNATRLHDERLGALRHLSSSGRGLRATVDEQIARWNESANNRPLVGRMGLGLPLSNIYATYFGGSLDLVSMDGWGTDVYLMLPRLGTNLEGLEV